MVREWFTYVYECMRSRLPSLLIAILTFVVALGWPRGQVLAADRAPNIVWLVQDHVPWRQFVGADGPKPVLPTLERLAADSVVFEQARTVTPLCAPARASMMTGAYPHNHGVTGNDAVVRDRSSFLPEYRSFNQYLQANGYVAGYFGKWHAGTDGTSAAQLGFTGYAPSGYGEPYTSKEYARYLQEHNLPKPVVEQDWGAGSGLRFGPATKTSAPASNGYWAAKLTTPVETHESYFVASLASDWIDQRVASGDGRPFVLRVDTWGPHQPYQVAEPFFGTINPKDIPEYPNFSNTFADRPTYHQQRRNYYQNHLRMTKWEDWQPLMARVYENFAQTDSAFLQVLDALERNGLTENTIIIYTADHGDIVGSGGGLFDKDAFMTEEVMSIPLLIKWPGVTDGGRKSTAFVSNLDIVPTVLDMAGVKVPEAMDGESLVPLLQHPDTAVPREVYMAEHHGHMNTRVVQRALYYQNYKYVAHLDDKHELYDLAADPFEMVNRIDDPAMQPVLDEMKSRLLVQMIESNDDAPDAKRLIQQMGGDYATVGFADQELRISLFMNEYSVELPYGTAVVPEPSIQPIADTADARIRGKQLRFQVNSAQSLPGTTTIETYNEAGMLIHKASVRFSVADRPVLSINWGDNALNNSVTGAVFMGGAKALSVTSPTPGAVFTRVRVTMTPVVNGEPAVAEAKSVYEGANLPSQAFFDSRIFPDGAYELQVFVDTISGATFSETVRVVLENWSENVDELEPPQTSGWFGVVQRRKTVAESDGWVSVKEPEFADISRLATQAFTPQYLIWDATAASRFTLTLYTRSVATLEGHLSIAVSADKQTWHSVSYTVSEVTPLAQGWQKVTLSGDLGANGGTTSTPQFLRLLLESSRLPVSDVQLGQMAIIAPNDERSNQ